MIVGVFEKRLLTIYSESPTIVIREKPTCRFVEMTAVNRIRLSVRDQFPLIVQWPVAFPKYTELNKHLNKAYRKRIRGESQVVVRV